MIIHNPGPRAQSVKTSDFDFDLILNLTCDLNLKLI